MKRNKNIEYKKPYNIITIGGIFVLMGITEYKNNEYIKP